MTTALDGIRILDLTRLLPGAIATMMLADMGADVIKIEDPHAGDYARWMPPLIDGLGAFFRASNRNKRSMIINLKAEQGQAVFHRLVQESDVVLEGFRPGVAQRLKADYDTLREINPRIVYCSLSGWGQTGPYRELSGHDLNYVSLNGLQGSMKNPQPLGGQIGDVGGSYVGIMGILAALFKRERTGEGDYIDVALSESAMPFAMFQLLESLVSGLPGGGGTLTGLMAYYDIYHSSDGKPMAFAPMEPKFWQNFCDAVERPDWVAPHHDLNEQERLRQEISDLFATKTAAEWHDILADADCCFSLVTPPAELPNDPQIQARQMLTIGDDGVPYMRSPVRLSSGEFTIGAVPQHGEHTRAVLEAIGYSTDEIESLNETGAVKLFSVEH